MDLLRRLPVQLSASENLSEEDAVGESIRGTTARLYTLVGVRLPHRTLDFLRDVAVVVAGADRRFAARAHVNGKVEFDFGMDEVDDQTLRAVAAHARERHLDIEMISGSPMTQRHIAELGLGPSGRPPLGAPFAWIR